MQYFDEYLSGNPGIGHNSCGKNAGKVEDCSRLMEAAIVRDYQSRAVYQATIIPEIINLIAAEYHLNETTAMRNFYRSDTAKAFNDPETGLYGRSA